IMGLLPRPAGRIVGGTIIFDGHDLTRASDRQLRALRGDDMAMIFQDPMTSLNPVFSIGFQLIEPLKKHLKLSTRAARTRAAELLITPDLGVIAGMCDRVVVMYGGRVLETGTNDAIFLAPRQPYTQGLLQSIPRLDQPRGVELTPIPGNPPDMLHLLPGCPFT